MHVIPHRLNSHRSPKTPTEFEGNLAEFVVALLQIAVIIAILL